MTGSPLDLRRLAAELTGMGWDVSQEDGLIAVRVVTEGVIRLGGDHSGRLLITYTRQLGPERKFRIEARGSQFTGQRKIIEEVSIAFVETDASRAVQSVAQIVDMLREGKQRP